MGSFLRTTFKTNVVRDSWNPLKYAQPERECNHPADCSILAVRGWRYCFKCLCVFNDDPEDFDATKVKGKILAEPPPKRKGPPKQSYPAYVVIQVTPD